MNPYPDTDWIKARASGGNGGSCVELRRRNGLVEVRDSKNPDGPALRFNPDEVAAWLDGAKSGEFDHFAAGS